MRRVAARFVASCLVAWFPLLDATPTPPVCPAASQNLQRPIVSQGSGCTGAVSAQEFLEQTARPAIYDSSLAPRCSDGAKQGPTVVEAQLFLSELSEIDQSSESVLVSGYLRSWWLDTRLSYNDTSAGGCMDKYTLHSEEQGAWIWQPDLYIDNLISAKTSGMMVYFEVSPDGSVFKSQQVLLKIAFSFHLKWLPYDTQRARITVASFSEGSETLRLKPRGGVIGVGSSGLGLLSAPIESEVWNFMDGVDVSGLRAPGLVEDQDGWDMLHLDFDMHRNPKFFVSHVIMPCVMFSLVSYIQFWIDSAAVPARAFLAVFPVWIILIQSNWVNGFLPPTAQSMWLDEYVTFTMCLCNASAVLFGVVQFSRLLEFKREAKRQGLKKSKATIDRLSGVARKHGVIFLSLMSMMRPEERPLTPEELKAVEDADRAEQEAHERQEELDRLETEKTRSSSYARRSTSGIRTTDSRDAEGAAKVCDDIDKAPDAVGLEVAGVEDVHITDCLGSQQKPAEVEASVPVHRYKFSGDRDEDPDGSSWPPDKADAQDRAEVATPDNDARREIFRLRSHEATKDGVLESDLMFIWYLVDVFNQHSDGENSIDISQIRDLLRYFNIYMSTGQVTSVVAMYLRDHHEATPLNEAESELRFSQVAGLLTTIDSYTIKRQKENRTISAYFQSIPTSLAIDVIIRVLFPCVLFAQVIGFYSHLAAHQQ